MGRLRYAVIALLLVIAAGIAVVVAGGTDPAQVAEVPSAEEVLAQEPGPPAPSLDGAGEGWLNTDGPLTDADVEGQVVLYDFWTYSCVNCIRTLPYLRAWHDRYEDDGLVIIGVHSPEFEFEEDHDNVDRAAEEHGVTWPVVYDDEMEIWDSFQNRYWPAKYLFDRDGGFRFSHFGEGAYEETEDVIRALLGVDEDAPRADVEGEGGDPASEDDRALQGCSGEAAYAGFEDCQTPETYLGALRGALSFSSPQGLEEGTTDFTVPDPQTLHTAAAEGTWTVDGEAITSVSDGAEIAMRFHASEVNLVMAPPEAGAVDVVVELDGEPLAPDERGESVTELADGRTVVRVDVDDIYALLATDEPVLGTLTLTPVEPGVAAFAFTFGS